MSAPVLVTRPAEQAAELAVALHARGVDSVTVPTVSIDSASSAPGLDAMLHGGLDDADWLVITSANGAAALGARLRATGHSIPRGVRIAAVGPATADSLAAAGLRVDHVPERYLTVAIADGLGDLKDRRVVLARADAATPDLSRALLERGADVVEVVAYCTVEGPADSRDDLRRALARDLAGVTFTSSSTVRGLLRLASTTDRLRARTLPAFCIGPVTAQTARRLGFGVSAVAREHTAAGLAAAIGDYFHGGDR